MAADAQAWFAAHQQGEGAFAPIILGWEAFVMASQGHYGQARALYESTVERMRDRGMAIGVAIVAQVGWRIEMLAGDLVNAERVARAGVEQLEELGERGWASTQACQLGEALYALGRYDEAEAWVVKGLEMGGALDVYTQLTGLPAQAMLLARRGDIAAALRVAERAEQLAMATEAPMLKGNAALARAEVLFLSGDAAGAKVTLDRAIDLYEQKGVTAFTANALRVSATWQQTTGSTR
jgi:tetratricopeptide (TPR) repeat protein